MKKTLTINLGGIVYHIDDDAYRLLDNYLSNLKHYFRKQENEPCGYVSIQQQEKDVFHLQKIYVLPRFQGTHCGSFLFKEAIKCIKEIHPGSCLMELNVNRNNKALQFYEHMGMRKLREGDFPIGNGYYMNDYIMGLDI